MIDQLIIGGKASFDDFGASVATRDIKMPKKKSIKETVPFSNRTYDFSAINGEIYWEERPLVYVFEMTADTPDELEDQKSRFASWVANVREQELHDPIIFGRHFIATYDDMTAEDDEGLDKTTVTVTFTAYPYTVADFPKVYDAVLPPSTPVTITVLNESAHPVELTITNSTYITVKVGTAAETEPLPPGSRTYGALLLPVGRTNIVLTNRGADDGVASVSFREEVF